MPQLRLTVFGLLLLAISCTKKNVPGPAGPKGPNGTTGTDSTLRGDLTGNVILYDTSGHPLADLSGAAISLENTSPLIQTTTAADGSFTLKSVNEGNYTVSVQKQGFGIMRYLNTTNPGSKTPTHIGNLQLAQQMPSGYDIKSLRMDSIVFPADNLLSFTITLAHPQQLHNPSINIYISDSTGVGINHCVFVSRVNFTQVNDSTLTYSNFALPIAGFTGRLAIADYLYFTVAIDNPAALSYLDEKGYTVTPAAAKPAPEVMIVNTQHKF